MSRLLLCFHEFGDSDIGIASMDMADLLEDYVSSNKDDSWMTLEMAKEDLKAFLPIEQTVNAPDAQHEEPPRKKPAYTSGKTLVIPQAGWQHVPRPSLWVISCCALVQ
jgi:hypothetical protein